MTRDRDRVAAVVWATVVLCFVWALAADVPALPGSGLGVRRFRTPELGPELTLSQTFKMTGDGLHAIEFYPAPGASRGSGDVRLALSDVTGADAVVREATIQAARLTRGGSYRFEFVPIVSSKNRTYRFDLSTTEASSAVGVWATRGDSYPGGTLLANGRSRWADLVFRTSASTRSLWRVVWWEAPLGRIALGALAVGWLALGFIFRRLAQISAISPLPMSSPQAR